MDASPLVPFNPNPLRFADLIEAFDDFENSDVFDIFDDAYIDGSLSAPHSTSPSLDVTSLWPENAAAVS
jgi:hypothetical protein